jgi:hypothetical protein
MASGQTDYMQDALNDHYFTDAAFTATSPYYVAAWTTAPGEDGTGGTEVTGGSYARVSSTSADWGSASAGDISNTSTITFPTATASWGTVVALTINSASSGGNDWFVIPLTSSIAIGIDDVLSFTSGNITVSLSWTTDNGFLTAGQNSWLDHVFGNATWSPGATKYMGGLTTKPTGEDGTGAVEENGTSYARQAVAAADFAASSAGTKENTSTVTWGPAGAADWGTWVGLGSYTAISAGSLEWVGDLATDKAIGNGESVQAVANNLTLVATWTP